jgi:aminopeptidase N
VRHLIERAARWAAALLPACAMAVTIEPPPGEPAPGISQALAQWRSAHYRLLRYDLRLRLTPALDRVHGSVGIAFAFVGPPVDLVLDWRPARPAGMPPGGVTSVRVAGRAVATPEARDDHLVIAAADLRAGENHVELEFETPIAAAGTAVTRYHDREDGSAYVYSLLVPADASSLFPCIDQPDLKARFTLELALPARLTAVSNGPAVEAQAAAGGTRWRFAQTEPISTYLFAFAAGPFAEFRDEPGGTRLLVRKSRAARAQEEAAEVLRLNRAGLRFLEDYFARPLPFAKYDLVLLPEFAYGGMEHAGATFLREDAVLFPFEPGAPDLLRRAQLLFHEAAHQWFGDLTTMRWFDDLWLKEGFANLMAFEVAAAIVPELGARSAFRSLKAAAYRTDVTAGTTPIWQVLPNLSAAKSAYGSIVYSKAPAVLRQAQFYLGEDTFRRAVRDFLDRHAYASATWADLVHAFERASGRDLTLWARRWVREPGLPRVRVESQLDGAGAIQALRLVQHGATARPARSAEARSPSAEAQSPSVEDRRPAAEVWPMRVELLLDYGDGAREVLPVTMEAAVTTVPAAAGRPAPRLVFANHGDWGYGLFELDAGTRERLLGALGSVDDAFLRALLWDALWQAVRDAELAPVRWIELALRQLPAEQDEVTVSGLLAHLETALRWYLGDAQRGALQPQLEALLRERMLASRTLGLRIAYFRAFVAMAWTPAAREDLMRLLSGELIVPGLRLRAIDRFRIVRTLLILDDPRAEGLLAAQGEADASDDGRRFAFATAAARGDPAAKRRYFDAFLHDATLPDRWIEEALQPFNAVEQDGATAQHLDAALQALPALKRTRRIFFVNNWLAAFIGGQRSAAAQARVQAFLQRADLDADLRLKVLEALDGLVRTVRVRQRYAGG